MRILHTIGRTEDAAATAELLETARWQAAQGCKVVLATPPLAAADAEAAQAAGIVLEVVALGSGFAEREAALLRAAVRRHAIEVIHAHDEAAALPALLSADMCPVVRAVAKG